MNKYIIGSIGFLIFVIIILAIYFFFIRGRFDAADILPPGDITPTVSPTLAPDAGLTPIPDNAQVYEGILSAVSTDRLGYKNSIIVVLDTAGAVPTTVYVTQTTQVLDVNRNTISRDTLRPDMRVLIAGVPAEGAIEAVRVEMR